MSPRAPLAVSAAAVALAIGCGGDDGSAAPEPGTQSAAASSPAAGGGDVTAAARGVRLRRIGRFRSPTYVTAPRGDRSRVFVVEQPGTIRVVRKGRKLSRPFLNLRSRVLSGGERGLLSMAFARDYARSRRFYVYYTDHTGDIRIQEFRRSARNPNVAARASARNLLTIRHREFGNHNGGQLQVGPDGMLWAGVGDGGSGGDPHGHGQSLRTRLAKLLRIDPRRSGRRAYRIPRNNPFRHRRGAKREIWAYGLRNPWRFSFDRRTGALVIADVGQDAVEEVDFAPHRGRGANYGWNHFEGHRRYPGGRRLNGHARGPVLTHRHSAGFCSITGGYVVRDRSLGGLYGRYVYGDYCSPGIRSVKLSAGRARGDRRAGISVPQLTSFGEDAAGHVYAVSQRGPVYRLVHR